MISQVENSNIYIYMTGNVGFGSRTEKKTRNFYVFNTYIICQITIRNFIT